MWSTSDTFHKITFKTIFAVPTFDKECGSVLTDDGWLFSPSENGGFYENDLNCWWLIVADLYQVVTINIIYIDIEYNEICGYDFLTVGIKQIQA